MGRKKFTEEQRKASKIRRQKYMKEWRKNNPTNITKHARRKYFLKYKYGLTPDDFNRMMKEQDSCCFICKDKFNSIRATRIDHCHTTGKIRNILCMKCNLILGFIKEDILIAQKIVEYIRTHKGAGDGLDDDSHNT